MNENEVFVEMPLQITPYMIRRLRHDPTTGVEDQDEWHKRLGWLICAWDVLIEARPRRIEADAPAE